MMKGLYRLAIRRLIPVLATVFLAAPVLAENRLALVIGNDAYNEIEPLDRAVADARAYRDLLQDQRGFRVFYAENAGRREMNARVAEFLGAIQPGDTAMIVYSGHGVQLDSQQRDSLYLLPTDFPNQDPGRGAERHFFDSESLNFARLAENVAARGAKLRIFVLDACRNNPFNRESGTRAIGLTRGIGRIQSSRGEFVIYAAAPGEVAFDSLPGDGADSTNSVFTRAFIKHFRTGVYLEDVANDVQAEVVRLARAANVSQEPYYSDGVAGRTCLDAACGAIPAPEDAKIVAEQENLYWKYCAENTEPVYCKAFIERYPESWRAGLAEARLKVLAERGGAGERLAAVERTGRPGDTDRPPEPAKSTITIEPDGGDGVETTAPPDSAETKTEAKKETKTESDGALPLTGTGPDASEAIDGAGPEPDGSVSEKTGTDDPKAVDGSNDEPPKDPDSTELAAVDPAIRTTPDTPGAEEPAGPATLTREELRDAQARLMILGHRPGPLDGLMGKRTRAAVSAFQKDNGLDEDGILTDALLARLTSEVPASDLQAFWAERQAAANARAERTREARERAARERAARREAARTRKPSTPTTPKTNTDDAARRAAIEARRRAEAERAREAERQAEAAKRREAEDKRPGIRLKTIKRTDPSKLPAYCRTNLNRYKWDPSCR